MTSETLHYEKEMLYKLVSQPSIYQVQRSQAVSTHCKRHFLKRFYRESALPFPVVMLHVVRF